MIDEAVIREAMDALAAVDPDVAKGRELVGDPEPRIRPHGFETLLRIIVSQQISTYAAAAIMARVEERMGDRTAESFLALNDEALRNCGLSARKVEYARDRRGHCASTTGFAVAPYQAGRRGDYGVERFKRDRRVER